MIATILVYCSKYPSGELLNDDPHLVSRWTKLMIQNVIDEISAAASHKFVAKTAFVSKVFIDFYRNRKSIGSLVEKSLAKHSFIDPLIKAILMTALAEAIYTNQHLNAAVLMDEYTNVASMFFGEDEVSMINGKLNGLISIAKYQFPIEGDLAAQNED